MLFNVSAQAIPSTRTPDLKVGTEYCTDKAKVKFYTNIRSLVSELNWTYMAKNNFAIGSNLVLNK